MNIIGITGGIGTGKSSVLQYMKEKEQAYVVEADKLAHELMQPGKIAYNRIVEHFAEAILDENQVIDRKNLSFWSIDSNVSSQLKYLGKNALYDFEAISGIKYAVFPKEYTGDK